MERSSEDLAAPRGLELVGPIGGVARVPGSKSVAQRVLACAAVALGRTRIVRVPDGDDVQRFAAALARAGARVERIAPAALAVDGRPPGPGGGIAAGGELDAGESGTGTRLLAALLALCGRPGVRWELGARGTLRARTSAPLFDALARAGVAVEPLGERGGWPVRITSIGPPSDLALERPRSSQEVSALVIAASAWPDEIRIAVEGEVPSRPYLDMTLGVLAAYGVEWREERGEGAPSLFAVRGPLVAPETPWEIEPDASSAAVALAAACITGGEARVEGFGARSLQGDVRIVEHLRAFGCRAAFEGGALVAGGRPARGARIDLAGEPDLAPPLAAVAAAAAREHGAESVLDGLATLARKESSRVEVLADGLARAGLAARAETDRLVVGPGPAPRAREGGALVLDPHGDHRMAFAFALLGLVVPDVRVRDPGCVAKSWPGFWEEMERLGARLA